VFYCGNAHRKIVILCDCIKRRCCSAISCKWSQLRCFRNHLEYFPFVSLHCRWASASSACSHYRRVFPGHLLPTSRCISLQISHTLLLCCFQSSAVCPSKLDRATLAISKFSENLRPGGTTISASFIFRLWRCNAKLESLCCPGLFCWKYMQRLTGQRWKFSVPPCSCPSLSFCRRKHFSHFRAVQQ